MTVGLFSLADEHRSGDDADISENYYSKQKDGTLWIGADDLWIAQAKVKE